jgi:hypothetical protein
VASGLIVLGAQPEHLIVSLTTGADFRVDMVLRDATYPSGSTLSLILGATTWTATISGDTATFSKTASVADTIADKTTAKLVYTDSAGTQVWAVGEVRR